MPLIRLRSIRTPQDQEFIPSPARYSRSPHPQFQCPLSPSLVTRDTPIEFCSCLVVAGLQTGSLFLCS